MDLPEVHDEASPTPAWISIVGVLVITAMALAALVRGAMPREPATAPATEAAAPAEPAPAADEAPAPEGAHAEH
jgi:hypothetical protein